MSRNRFTSRQRRYMEILADPFDGRTREEIARELKVHSSTLYRWQRTAGFPESVNELVRERTDRRMAKVWEALLSKAESGDVQAIRLVLQARGELKENKGEEAPAPPEVVEIVIAEARTDGSPGTRQG